MTGPWMVVEQAIASFVLHALWQAPLLAGAAALAIRVGRPTARIAHVLWAGTLLLCVLMPVGATITARRAALEAERNAAVTVTYVATDYSGPLPEMQRKPAWQRMLNKHFNLRDGVRPFAFTLLPRLARTVALLYLLVAVGLGMRLLLAWRRSRRFVRGASALATDSPIAMALQRQCEGTGIHAPPVRVSSEITGPALAGVLHPTLLLPACTDAMTTAEIEAVLAHELAHLRRRDLPVHMVCSLLLVPVGFHPAVLWVAQRVRQTREMACDAEAAEQMGSATRYAHALLQVAERTGAGGLRVAGLGLFQSRLGLFEAGLGLFNTGLGLFPNGLELTGGAMEERMRMIMERNQSTSAAGRAARWTACVAVGATAMLAAAMLQVQPALAQQAVAAAPAPVVGAVEEQTPLLSGSHAQQQLRKAGHDLAEAERKATTDEERAKIATARAVVGAAQSQLAAASGHEGPQQIVVELGDLQGIDPQVRVQLDRLKVMKIDPKLNIQLKALEDLKLDAKTQAEIAKAQKIDMKKMQADIDASRAELERVMSPEFQAQIKAQVDEARKVNRAQIDRAMAEAKKQVEAAVQAQKQAMAASQLVARNDAPVMPVPAEVASQAEQQPIKIDASKMAGNKIGGSNPVYPEAAKKAHISGSVLIHAIIDEKGNVEDAKVLRENAPDNSLAEAALYAVMNWKYRPYLLNGNPTAVETTITVNFSLTN